MKDYLKKYSSAYTDIFSPTISDEEKRQMERATAASLRSFAPYSNTPASIGLDDETKVEIAIAMSLQDSVTNSNIPAPINLYEELKQMERATANSNQDSVTKSNTSTPTNLYKELKQRSDVRSISAPRQYLNQKSVRKNLGQNTGDPIPCSRESTIIDENGNEHFNQCIFIAIANSMNTLRGINLTPLQLRNSIMDQDKSLVDAMSEHRFSRILYLVNMIYNVQIGVTIFGKSRGYSLEGKYRKYSRFIEISWSLNPSPGHFRALRPRSH